MISSDILCRVLVEKTALAVDDPYKRIVVIAPTHKRFMDWLHQKFIVLTGDATKLRGLHMENVENILLLEDYEKAGAFSDPALMMLLGEAYRDAVSREEAEREERECWAYDKYGYLFAEVKWWQRCGAVGIILATLLGYLVGAA